MTYVTDFGGTSLCRTEALIESIHGFIRARCGENAISTLLQNQ